MIESIGRGRKRLPPPVATMLLYAADGLAVESGSFSPLGFPRTPERTVWVPKFREWLETPEGRRLLKDSAETGMRAWHCPAVYLECLDAAFRDIGFRARAIGALDNFAATARERFAIAERPRHRSDADGRARPVAPKGSPSLNSRRPKGPGPKPR